MPRSGGDAEERFSARVREEWVAVRERAGAAADGAAVMFRLADDAFGPRTPWRAAVEISGWRADERALAPLVSGLGARLADVAHADLGTALVGRDHVLVPSERAPVRYQYLMRRRADFTHAAYLVRYRTIHAQFGLRTPGILGYVQLHVDPTLSSEVAAAAGFGVHAVDSVSELHLASVQEFLRAIAASDVGPEAVADEQKFVDRAASFDFVSEVEWLAPPA